MFLKRLHNWHLSCERSAKTLRPKSLGAKGEEVRCEERTQQATSG